MLAKVLIFRTLLSYLFLFCAILPSAIAQNKKTANKKKIAKQNPAKQNPIIEENLNVISFSANLTPFLLQLKQIKKQGKKVTILHIGDSHIQAGFFTEKMRQLLQNKYGNGGRGLIFPYQIANSTQPETYLATKTGEWTTYNSTKTNQFSQWGLTGFTALTKDEKATITLRPSHKHPEKITRTKIFYPLFDKTSFDLKLLAKRQDIKSSKIDMNGYVEYRFKTPQPLVSLYFGRQHTEQTQFLLQGMTFENDEKGVAYHVAGVNGAKIESFLRCADFQKHVAALKPDLVIISLGTNEALVPNFKADLFKANCRLLLWQIRKAMPQACVLFTSPNVSCNFDKKPNPHLDTLSETLREIAKSEKAAFWNFYAISGKKENVETWKNKFLLKNDGIHLTRQGYELQGELLFKALMRK